MNRQEILDVIDSYILSEDFYYVLLQQKKAYWAGTDNETKSIHEIRGLAFDLDKKISALDSKIRHLTLRCENVKNLQKKVFKQIGQKLRGLI